MDQTTPIRPAHTGDKRPHTDLEDEEAPQGTTTTAAGAVNALNPNICATLEHFMVKKRLHGEQKAEVEIFLAMRDVHMSDPAPLREAKAYAQCLQIENLLERLVAAKPVWVPSDDLRMNINSYAAAVLLSAKLTAYKGNIPKNIVLVILKKHCFDLPTGIENNPADWGKVADANNYAFTQLRSKFKKLIKASLCTKAHTEKDRKLLPKKDQQNIFVLTQLMVEGTQCEVNVLLCPCIAFMRVFIKDESTGFWNTVDDDLSDIRKKANNDNSKIVRAFRHILKEDRAKHGVDNYTIANTVDTFQQEVDDVVEASGGTADADAGLSEE
ncbi:hypothetical protein DFH07DRAFT_950767 [Mycena maculata]|uniref:Uncharacterized protein n=1 Tax=Mycena maculata TaxID=230809 RepID=A0AAD7K5D0_9AGAR|nr:hypothetical protein DFH07DRAFT_950767 [Mycena maculata]